MKKILGLDIGTTSIGWAYVHEAENRQEQSSIIELGVRVNPLSTDEQNDFLKGKPITTNAQRRLKRGMRRNLHRYKLRRDQLIALMLEHGFITQDTPLYECGKDTTYETLRIRSAAAKERIELEQLARVLLSINRKRGYRSSRKVKSSDEGTIVDGMELAKELYEQKLTPGQWLYKHIGLGKLKGKPDFYRSDLVQELNLIWQLQKTYYPEVLTDELYESIQGKGQRETTKRLIEHSHIDPAKNEGDRHTKLRRLLRWRAEAATQQLTLGELWVVIGDINKSIASSSGYLGEISDRSKELFFNRQTVGEYLYDQIVREPHRPLRGQVFYRQDYLNEFEQIWETQKRYHPQLTDELKAEIRDVVIFYQRRLRSQKGLIDFCELEAQDKVVERRDYSGRKISQQMVTKTIGPRVAPRSSPLFQEFKIWQTLNNILIRPQGSRKRKANEEAGISALSLEQKSILFEELNIKGYLKAEQALSLLGYSSKEWEMNYSELAGNTTNAELYRVYLKIAELEGCDLENHLGIRKEDWSMSDISRPASSIREIVRSYFDTLGIDKGLLEFDGLLRGKAFQQQASYALWHLLYSYEGDNSATGNETLYRLLEHKYGFAPEHCRLLGSIALLPDYGNLSTKALRKILPYIPEHTYSDACALAGYRHSQQSLTKQEIIERPLKDKLSLMPKGTLRQPIVEKILNQLINLVNQLIDKYSLRDEEGNIIEVFRFDEIRVELSRELKSNAKQREERTQEIKNNQARHEKITSILKSEFGIQFPSHNDILRYRLYEEIVKNGGREFYRNKTISKEQLFSPEIDIEHIIPKARLFDDSFSNKTLAYHRDNQRKGDRTAFDYISQDHAGDLDDYVARIEDLKSRKVISEAKALKLLKPISEIGDGFIARDLRATQYISRKAREILLEISRSVVATSGQITSRLREDWGLINLMKEMNLPKYRSLGRTETIHRRSDATIEVITDWSKRDDHRHHAMDALTVAFTKHSHIQYLNHLNAHYEERKSQEGTDASDSTASTEQPPIASKADKDGIRRTLFQPPMPNFRREARLHLERILISHKAKNKATTRNRNHPKGSKKEVQICLTPRGELHKETIYGKRKRLNPKPCPINKKFRAEQVDLIASREIRQLVKEHIALYPSIDIALDSKTLKKHPILYRGEPLKEVVCYDEIFTIRKPITPDIKIEDVLDGGARSALQKRLEEYGGNAKLAFSDLEENPIWLNERQGICLKSVTIKAHAKDLEPLRDKRTASGALYLDPEGKTIPIDYAANSSNHHSAIYRDAKGVLQERVVSLMEAVTRVSAGLEIIDKSYNKELGWEFLFTLKQNEMFVFPNPATGFSPLEIDLLDPQNKAIISPNLYRVQKLSKRDYYFRHHLETSVTHDIKEVTFKRIGINSLEGSVKVRLNHLGDIVEVGEY